MRILFSCMDLGLGHVSRAIPLGKKLQERGNELFFYSGGKAYELLKKEFSPVHYCTPVAWYENAYGIIVSASLLNILLPLPQVKQETDKFAIKSSTAAETIHRYYELRHNIKTIRPDLILSDGDIHALRLAHRWKIRAVYITNVIRPSYNFSPIFIPGERFTERYVRKCAKIIVPDNPHPLTVCEYNLGDLDTIDVKGKVEFVGSFSSMVSTKGSEEHIFAPISGPYGTRTRLIKTIIPVFRKLQTKSIVSLGKPGEKKTRKVGNCEIHTWLSREEREEFMRNAKIIVFSGAHTTFFEIIKHAKPSICIPTQPEQMGNAKKMEQLGCSMIVKNEKQLELAVQEMEERQQFYRNSVKVLNKFSCKFDGLENAINLINEAGET